MGRFKYLVDSEEAIENFKALYRIPLGVGIRRQRSTLQQLLESQPGRDAPGKATQTRLPAPPPIQPFRANPTKHKRKREDKGKEVVEAGKTQPPHEAIQATFAAKEMVSYSNQRMKEEEGRRIAAMDAFHVAEKSNQELKNKLQEEEKGRKSATAALHTMEKQAEGQREAKKAKEEAEQHSYDIGRAETEDALRAEVPAVCRTYCALVWDEALNQAGVEASSTLRKVESVYYPQAIRPSSSKANPVSSESGELPSNPSKTPPTADPSPKEVEQAEGAIKLEDTSKETTQGVALPPVTPKETHQNVELVLATLPIPPKDDPK
ncbi:hypothetical protein SO802_020642 [Lithocarpus litseifolius]|uniref:Uncharacterized protein n=1 Tax=Lithocarpus litseifolius TaxID=425828 RepID=A0AAW2CCF0_9ROSI